jgi:hypothetical protein
MDHIHGPAAEFRFGYPKAAKSKIPFPVEHFLFNGKHDGKWHFGFCGIRIFKTMIQSQTGTMAMNLL